MSSNVNIVGSKSSLFGVHGSVDADKCIEALVYMSEQSEIDIDKINKASEQGGIYIKDNGKILNGFGDNDEFQAKYKMVPTGMKLRFSDYPLFASFIKLNGMWEGAFIGTGTQLFTMYKDHYNNKSVEFSDEYLEIFGGIRRTMELKGFGLDGILKDNDIDLNSDTKTVYKDTNELSAQEGLEKAIEKALKQSKTSNKKSSKNGKKQRKAAMLQAHLEKMRINNERKQKQEKDNVTAKSKTEEKVYNEVNPKTIDDIHWIEISEPEDLSVQFEDFATIQLNKRIQDYVNGDIPDEECGCSTEPEIEVKALVESTNKNTNEYINTNYEEDDDLVMSMDHDIVRSDPEKDKFKEQLKADLVQDIYERLLIKEQWKCDKIDRLGYYLKGIFMVVEQSMENSRSALRGNGYTLSENRDKAIVNTGLMDIYGNYIYLIDHTPDIKNFYDKKITLLNSKVGLLNIGFSLENARNLPEPVMFVEDKSQLIFDGNIEDFDLDDDIHLNHIIEERRDRFPEKYKNTSQRELSYKIKNAIVQAVKLSKVDYRYILPKYDFFRHKIQFLIPFHLDTNIDEKPELTIVIGKQDGLWIVYTVLYTSDAYEDARLLCRPYDSWLDK